MNEPRRKLTEEEFAHAKRLLWGSTGEKLAAHLGVTGRVISHCLSKGGTLPLSVIEKLNATTPETVPKKDKAQKPKLFFASPRSPLLSYPRKPLH